MVANSGKPITYGNKMAYQHPNQNRTVGRVNLGQFNTGNLPQNNGFSQGQSQQKRGFAQDASLMQTQPIPSQQQTQQQVNAQYNTRHAFGARQGPIQANANNLAQTNRGRMGVRGFLDPSVGVTGIGINN